MSGVRFLGTGYYGIEASGVAIKREVLDRMSDAFKAATGIPDDRISIAPYHAANSDAAKAMSPALAAAKAVRKGSV